MLKDKRPCLVKAHFLNIINQFQQYKPFKRIAQNSNLPTPGWIYFCIASFNQCAFALALVAK